MLAVTVLLNFLYTKAILASISRWLRLRQLSNYRKCAYDRVFSKKRSTVLKFRTPDSDTESVVH